MITIHIRAPRFVSRLNKFTTESCKFVRNYFHYRARHAAHTEACQLARNTTNIQSKRLHN